MRKRAQFGGVSKFEIDLIIDANEIVLELEDCAVWVVAGCGAPDCAGVAALAFDAVAARTDASAVTCAFGVIGYSLFTW